MKKLTNCTRRKNLRSYQNLDSTFLSNSTSLMFMEVEMIGWISLHGYYHGYPLFDKKKLEVAYPFGFGLSYTTYEYDNLQTLSPEINKEGQVSVSVDVTNTGIMMGAEVIQFYVGFKILPLIVR